MQQMILDELSSERSWAKQLGLLPVPLYAESRSGEFVMLNGDRGNFCLALTPPTLRTGRDLAWSSDVGHYLFLEGKRVVVERWDRRGLQDVPLQSIADDIERFRRYLEENDPRQEASIVAHVMNAFSVLRSVLSETLSGEQSVRALLIALAALDSDASPREINLESWGIAADASDVVGAIPAATWNNVLRMLRGGDQELVAVPELVLRHAAGRVFQEANYIVQLPAQMSLPGVEVRSRLTHRGTALVGVYYTPPAIARTMVEQSLKQMRISSARPTTVFDPACGSGEFLREAVRQIGLRDPAAHIDLVGFDISSSACDMTRFVLAAEQRQNPGLTIRFSIKQTNALLEKWPRADLIIMNPPFVEYRELSEEQKANLATVLTPAELSFRSDLSMAFLALACSSLDDVGVLAALMPASLLEGDSGAQLRSERLSELSLKLVAKLGNQYAFSKVKVDAAILVASRGVGDDMTAFLWADHRRDSLGVALRELRKDSLNDREGDGYSIYVQRVQSAEELMPRPLSAVDAYKAYQGLPRTDEFFDVRQGVLTGNNEAFLVPRDYFEALPARERRFFRPAIVNASLYDGRIREVQYVFYPYGKHAVENEAELKTKLKTFYNERLKPLKAAILQRARVKKDHWWLLTEPRTAMSTGESKLVSTYFGDRGSFGWDAEGRYMVVQGYAWLPKDDYLKALFSSTCALGYLALLNSALFGKLLQAKATHVAGGQLNLSKRYVREVPIPNLFVPYSAFGAPPLELLADLAECGRAIQSGNVNWERVDEFSRAAYESVLPIGG